MPALLRAAGLAGAELRELRVTTTERLARLIAGFAWLFLIGGLLGIYIEIKTPGFGLPGILGILCLAIFFWGHHIAGLAGFEDMLLFLLGAALIVVEVIFFPGTIIFGVLGVAMMLWALFSAMVRHLPGGPWPFMAGDMGWALFSLAVALIGTSAGAVALGRFYPRLPVLRHLVLDPAVARPEGFAAAGGAPGLVGLTGRALSALRPAGTALFGDRRLDVVTRGDYIDAGQPIRIVETEGARIVVETDAEGRA